MSKRDGVIRIGVNGHALTIRVDASGKRWFECATFADLPAKYDGATDSTEYIEAFERRALGLPEPGDEQKASA
jgi:hypothetical protein